MAAIKNIAIIIESLTGGGAERVAGLLSLYLTKKYKVFLFVINDQKITYKYGGTVVRLGDNGFTNDLFNAKEKYSIDCAISFSENMNYANIRTKGKELVIISHRNTTGIKTKDLPTIKQYYPFADAVVACSEGCRQLLIENADLDPSRVVTIYNFINKKEDSGLADSIDYHYVLNVGRLTWEKNQKALIRQFVEFRKNTGSSTKLLIIGTGVLQQELQYEIDTLKASEYISIKPFVDNVSEYYKNAEAFVFSSVTEGFPNVLLDALSYELPVISTDCISGPREILDDDKDYSNEIKGIRIGKRGVLLQNDSEISKALEMVLRDKNLIKNLKENARDYIEKYSNEELFQLWDRTIQHYANNRQTDRLDESEYKKTIENADTLIVYGAGKYGQMAIKNERYCSKKVVFAVSDDNGSNDVNGIPIFNINSLTDLKSNSVVLIASYFEKNRCEMRNKATELGFKNVFLAEI